MEIRLTEDDVRARLRAACSAAGSQRAFASAVGLSEQYVSNVLLGRRPGRGLLAAVGVRKATGYVLVDGEKS